MEEKKFVESIYKLGSRIKKDELTDEEKASIIDIFNNLKGDPYDRAIKALEKTLGEKDVELLIEKSASLDDINRLIKDVSLAAKKWRESKK